LANVTAKITDNSVELSGTVASKADKDKARSIAESNAGGRKVVDHIEVSGRPPAAPPR
jgi:osmotically-inducible protein OsmY